MKQKRKINKGKNYKSVPYKLSPVTHERMKQIRWATKKTYDILISEMLTNYERKNNE